jgi:hypothetical protein
MYALLEYQVVAVPVNVNVVTAPPVCCTVIRISLAGLRPPTAVPEIVITALVVYPVPLPVFVTV